MNKDEIIKKLDENYKSFAYFIDSLDENDFMHSAHGKWNAGQQLDHLIKAVSPLSTGLQLPKFMIKALFGKANRPSKTFVDLVTKYQLKLQDGGKAKGRFVPKKIV